MENLQNDYWANLCLQIATYATYVTYVTTKMGMFDLPNMYIWQIGLIGDPKINFGTFEANIFGGKVLHFWPKQSVFLTTQICKFCKLRSWKIPNDFGGIHLELNKLNIFYWNNSCPFLAFITWHHELKWHVIMGNCDLVSWLWTLYHVASMNYVCSLLWLLILPASVISLLNRSDSNS